MHWAVGFGSEDEKLAVAMNVNAPINVCGINELPTEWFVVPR